MYIRSEPSRLLLIPLLRADGNGRLLNLAHGDMYPVSSPDGVINLSGLILILQVVRSPE